MDYRTELGYPDDLRPNAGGGYESDISTQLLSMGCAICGRPLRDPVSLERGWGPICDDKYMGGAGEAGVWNALQTFDEVEAEAALRSTPTVVPTRWIEPTRIASKGETLPDGEKAKGGEILDGKPLKPGSLRQYLVKHGGDPDRPNAPWRHEAEARRKLVSLGIWYASRAVTFGYDEDVIGAEKVDPRWEVVASVQRIARAFNLSGAADRMTQFYGAKVVKNYQEQFKALRCDNKTILFERVRSDHVISPGTRWSRKAGTNVLRIHVPMNATFNDQARQNRAIFFSFEKEEPYFWRYFQQKDLRQVVNLVQGIFGDQVCVTQDQQDRGEVMYRERIIATSVAVMDLRTQEVRWFSKYEADRLAASPRYKVVKVK